MASLRLEHIYKRFTDSIAVGLEDNDAGLAAAVLVIVLFTAYFTVSMIMRPFEKPEQPA